MQVIGIRKMAVIVWCAACITVVMCAYLYCDKQVDVPAITGMSLIAGLGGFHSYKQGLIDGKNGEKQA